MNFLQKLESAIEKNNSLLCIGLDGDIEKLPESIQKNKFPQFVFNKAIIEATHDIVCAYKPQIAHYSAIGEKGLTSLLKTMNFLKENYPEIPVILDAKRGDIGTTAELYTKEAFDVVGADAVTVNPYLGFDAIEPFLKRAEKGIIVLCRTSNKSASDFQDLDINGKPLYIKVAEKIIEWNNKFNNCMLVVGATWPEELKKIRELAPQMFFLVPGIGAQGGDLEQSLKAGFRADKSGLIIHSSRAIIYASSGEDFAEKARDEAQKLKDQINTFRT